MTGRIPAHKISRIQQLLGKLQVVRSIASGFKQVREEYMLAIQVGYVWAGSETRYYLFADLPKEDQDLRDELENLLIRIAARRQKTLEAEIRELGVEPD